MLAYALDERCHLRRQDVGLWKGRAIRGWHDNRGGQRGESQIGGTEALAAQVRTAVCEELGDVVQLAPDRGLVFNLDPAAEYRARG